MLKKSLLTIITATAIAFLGSGVAMAQGSSNNVTTASTTATHTAKEQAMLNKMKKEYPGLKIKDIYYHSGADLFELFSETVFTPTFMDSKGLFMFNNGEVIDILNKKNLTKRDLLNRDIKQKDKEDAFLLKIKKEHPTFNFIDATYLPTINLFELRHQNNKVTALSYANPELSYLFNSGDLLDLKNKVNLSAVNVDKRQAPLIIADSFKTLPLDTAIKMTYGKTGVRAIAVFSDPRCPWCRKMDTDIMRNLKGVDLDIYYFMNPLNIRGHEDAPEIASKVLCADDKVKTWKEWMLLGKKPENDGKACEAIVKKHLAIAIERRYDSTPVILTDTGFVLPSTLSSQRFGDFLKDTRYINQPNLIK